MSAAVRASQRLPCQSPQSAEVFDVFARRQPWIEPAGIRQQPHPRLRSDRICHHIDIVDQDSSRIRPHQPR